MSQRNAEKDRAYIDQKNSETDVLTEEYNSELRKGQRIQKAKETAAYNRTVGASSGIDVFSGSAAHNDLVGAGNLKVANEEDVFSTKTKVGQIREASRTRGRAGKARSRAAMLNTAGSIFNTASQAI